MYCTRWCFNWKFWCILYSYVKMVSFFFLFNNKICFISIRSFKKLFFKKSTYLELWEDFVHLPITSSEAHLKYELHLKYTMCLYKTKPWWHTFAILWLFIVNLLWITILGTFRFQFFNVNSSIFCDVCTYLLLSFLLRSLRSL